MHFNPWVLLLLLIPIVWYSVSHLWFKQEIDYRIAGVIAVITIIIGCSLQYWAFRSQTSDFEIWNSRIVKKYKKSVPCEHSYTCNCRTVTSGSGKDQTTTTVCDTCYEHSEDFIWVLEDSIDNAITIDRVDRQGIVEPPRWTKAKIDDPMATQHVYTNYIKAVPESLFNVSKGDYEKFMSSIPDYPGNIYDYHYIVRVISNGVPLTDINKWNLDLSNALRLLGTQREANIILLFTKNTDKEYAYAARKKWNGAKKNDIVVVVGTPNYPEISWVKVFALCNNNLFQVQLEQELMDMKTITTSDKFIELVSSNVMQNFKRKSMKDFEYLKAQINMPIWVIVFASIISLLMCVGSTAIINDWDFLKRRVRYNKFNSKRRW